MNGIERRKFLRLSIGVDVNWQRMDQSPETSSSKNTARNISEGGICLMVYEPLFINQKIKLEFTLPTGRLIKALGRIAWVDSFEVTTKNEPGRFDVGVEFIEIADGDRAEIQKHVFSCLKKEQKG